MAGLKKKQIAFLAPLDTVLRRDVQEYAPVLKFAALFNRHFVLSDTQILDNAMFRTGDLYKNLPILFGGYGNEAPLFLISKRSKKPLTDLFGTDFGRFDGSYDNPFLFSSLPSNENRKLATLFKKGKLDEVSMNSNTSYSMRFVRTLGTLTDELPYHGSTTWPRSIRNKNRFGYLMLDVLNFGSTKRQLNLPKPARRLYGAVIRRLANIARDGFGRGEVYSITNELCRKYKSEQRVTAAEARKTKTAIQSIADYTYLRNFADSSGFGFMVDETHWLASSSVNEELATERPSVETTDDLTEMCVRIREDAFGDYGIKQRNESVLSQILSEGKFTNYVSWSSVMKLRKKTAFWDGLDEIDQCLKRKSGPHDDTAKAINEHTVWCLRNTMGRKFNAEEFLVGAVCGGAGMSGAIIGSLKLATATIALQTAIGFVGAGGGAALWLGIRHLQKRRRETILCDKLSKGIVQILDRRRKDER